MTMEERVVRYASWVIRYRFVVMIGCIALTALAGLGMGRLPLEAGNHVLHSSLRWRRKHFREIERNAIERTQESHEASAMGGATQ